MAKKIADELQNLQYNDPQLHRGFSDAINGRPATSYDHMLVRLNDQLIDLRRSRDASRTEAERLRKALETLVAGCSSTTSAVPEGGDVSAEYVLRIARRALEGGHDR